MVSVLASNHLREKRYACVVDLTGKGCRLVWNYPEVADSLHLRHRNLLYCSLLILSGAQVTK
jgi:hypothetical protein